MASQIQYRRGTNAQNAAFTGALAEITVDTTNGTLRVHDAITAGGSNIATVAYVTSQISALSANSISFGTSSVAVIASGGNIRSNIAGSTVQTISSGLVAVTGNISVGNLLLSGAIEDSGQLDIQTSAANANIVFTPNGTGNVNTGANLSVTGRVTAASVVGGVISGSSVSVSGAVTGASVVGGVMTGTSVSVTGAVTGASVVGGVMTGTSVSVTGNITGANVLGGANVNATTHTGSTVSVSGTITGGNILTGGLISATGAITGANITGGNILTGGLISATGAVTGATITGTSLTVSTGNITGGNLIISGAIEDSGQLDIRTTASNGNIVLSPNGTGNINIGANIMPTANATANIGSATLSYNTIFAKATSAQYADLAEMYVADTDYAPGTVVEFGGDREITTTTTTHSTQVAGIISTQPAYLMNATQTGEYPLEVALVGRVPCQVVGTIRKGDRLVSSDLPGVAQALNIDLYQPGCIVGKALAEYNSTEPGVIEVAVGRA